MRKILLVAFLLLGWLRAETLLGGDWYDKFNQNLRDLDTTTKWLEFCYGESEMKTLVYPRRFFSNAIDDEGWDTIVATCAAKILSFKSEEDARGYWELHKRKLLSLSYDTNTSILSIREFQQ